MIPTHLLRKEHERIKQGLAVLAEIIRRLQQKKKIDVCDLDSLVLFFKEYADWLHHVKEEDLLFEVLVKGKIPRVRSMCDSLMTQHVIGRQLVTAMADAVTAMKRKARGAKTDFVEQATAYVTLLSIHICDEDNMLFALADRELRGLQAQSLVRRLGRFSMRPGFIRRSNKHLRMLDKLTRKYASQEGCTCKDVESCWNAVLNSKRKSVIETAAAGSTGGEFN